VILTEENFRGHTLSVGTKTALRWADHRPCVVCQQVTNPTHPDLLSARANHQATFGYAFANGDESPSHLCWGPIYLVEEIGDEALPGLFPAFESELGKF
jgi:hypothetical protein